MDNFLDTFSDTYFYLQMQKSLNMLVYLKIDVR